MQNLIPHFIQEQWQLGNTNGSFQAYTMFIDLSGFTMMTETLFGKGHDGAEQLTIMLNQIFEPMVSIVYQQNGFIPYFAGDAFTAIFIDDGNTEVSSIFFQTAFQLRELFQLQGVRQNKYGTFPIRIKIGLAYGEVHWGIVGNTRKAFFFKGEAIEACAKCQIMASEGEIITSKTMAGRFQTVVSSTPKIGQYYQLHQFLLSEPVSTVTQKLPPISEEVANYFLPYEVIKAQRTGEFRALTMLFISFEGVDDSESFYDFTTTVIDHIDSYAGYFKEIDISDKGAVITAFFGAPVAFENNTHRALSCAATLKEIVQPLLHQGLKYRIGITSGVAYTGIIGGQERCQYAAVGSSINLAARLMMCAEWGEILVGEQVQKERFFKFAFKGNITYKGIMEAVPTFQLVGKKEDEKNDFIGRMVGRDLQLSQLLQFIEPVLHEQNGRVIYIYGEAGIGKSRLAFEAKKNMLDRYDIEWFNCPCDQILRKPFNPFTTFLRQYFEQTSEQQAADNLKSFEIIFQQFIVDCQHSQHPEARSIIQELRRTRSVLAALVGLQTDNSLWEQLDAKGRFENALSAMRNFIMAAALQNPVIVEVEDIHWLDDYSKTLLSDIKKVMPQFPITLFFTARYNDDGSPTLLFERETTPTLQIDLNILSPEALTDFARARLSGGNISNELKEFFLRATNGNPFYIEQLLEYFKENNLLTLLNGEWHIKDNQVRLSDSINAVLTARIDRLSVIVKETVKAAAVIGREFEVPVLVEVMRRNDEYIKANGNTSNVVSEQVKTAERGQIWRAVNELRYIFKHALLREAVYDMQLRTRLRELHYLIAKAIEKLYENNLESRYVDLAYHYEQAERIEETNFYLKHAADNAFRNYQNKQALDFYEKLYSKFKKQNAIAKQVHTLLKMIKVLELTGNWQQCKVYLDTAQELLQEHPTLNITLAGRTYNSLGRLHMLQGAYTQAFEQLQHSVTYFEQDKDEIGLSKVYGDLGNLFLRQGKYEEAKAYFINSIQLGKGVLNPGSLAQNVANLGLTHMNLGEYADAIACQREQLELCKANNDKSGMAVLLTNMGIVCIDKGDYVEAQNCLEEGLQLSRALGNKQLTSIAMGCLGTVFEEQGNYSAARMCYKDDLQIVEELGDKQGIAIVYGLLGGLYSIQGEFEQAIEFLTINLHGCRQLGYKKGIAKALNNLADIYVLKQQFDAAIVHYSEAIQICRQIQNKLVLGQSLIERANIYIKTNQLGDAHTDWQESAGIAQQLGNAELQFDAAIVQGRLLAKKGEVNTAENLYNQLLQKASKEKDSAAIYFELYQLLNRNADKLAARQRYQQLYAKTPQYLYAIRLEILG